MKQYNLSAVACTFIFGMMLAACSDSDNWEPGPIDNNIGVDAYFQTPATTEYVFGNTDPIVEINVPVERRITEGEATVGVVLSGDLEGVTAPSDVTFADGESVATLTIDCKGIPYGQFCNISVKIDPDNSNIYGSGLNQVDYQVIKSEWLEIADNVRYLYRDFNGDRIYPSTYSKMYILDGTMVFKLEDFFGSGLDMTFECDTPDATVMMPRTNADFENVWDEDKADKGWYLYDEANQIWPTWTPGDAEDVPAITYLLFYSVSSYNILNMIYNSSTLYGYIGLTTGIDFDNGDFVWGDFQVDFNLKYNPFDKKTD